jgi:hypothetical protein
MRQFFRIHRAAIIECAEPPLVAMKDLRACLKIGIGLVILILIVSFGRFFEDENDDEKDSISCEF